MKKISFILCIVLSISLLFTSCGRKKFYELVLVKEIEIVNEGLKDNEEWGRYATVRADADGIWRFKIEYKLYPENVDNKSVRFEYDNTQEFVSVSKDGIVTFTEPGMIRVDVVSVDGSAKRASVTVIALQ